MQLSNVEISVSENRSMATFSIWQKKERNLEERRRKLASRKSEGSGPQRKQQCESRSLVKRPVSASANWPVAKRNTAASEADAGGEQQRKPETGSSIS